MQASVLLRSVLTGVACFLGATTVSAQSAPSDSIARLVAPYVTSFDGVVSHCGTDHYVMVWSGGRWLASQMVFTRRTEGCVAPR